MAEALYRKYRPQIFEDVVGQDHIERTLKNAIEKDKVSHAYLFTGPRGTGKTTTARLLAKALLCEKGLTSEPDGTCDNCIAIANGTHPDVYELDAASRTGVENVREEIIGRVQFASTQGRYKVYIIDEVHMLSTAAFNALLKTLEEPPSHVVFILCTTDPQKVPETIHSRCQRFDFHRISVEAMVSRLGAICTEEDVEFEGDALELIAHRAEGGMRNALTSLEQAIAFGEGKVKLETAESLLGSLDSNDLAEIVGAIGRRDVAKCFEWTSEYVETGADLAQFVRDLAEHFRNMYILSLTNTDTVLEVDEVIRRELAHEMQYFGPDRLTRMLGVLGDLISELKTSTNPRLSFEIALTRMVRPDSDLTLGSLAERVEALESGYSAVAHVPAGAHGTPVQMPVSNSAGSSFVSEPALQPNGVQASVATEGSAMSASSGFSPEQQVNYTETAGVAPASSFTNSPVQSASTQQDIAQKPPCDQPQTTPASSGETSSQKTSAMSLENPATLQRIWQAALQIIKKEKAAYSVLLLNTKVSYDQQSGSLVIEFPSENKFAYSAVQKPEVVGIMTKAIAQAAGSTIPFRITQGGEVAKSASASAPASVSASPASSLPTVSVSSYPSTAGPTSATPRAMTSAPPMTSAPASTSVSTPASTPTDSQQAPAAAASQQAPTATAPQQAPAEATSSAAAFPARDYDGPPLDIYDDYASSYVEKEGGYSMPSTRNGSYEAPAPQRAPVPQNTQSPRSVPIPQNTPAPQSTQAPQNTPAPQSTPVPTEPLSAPSLDTGEPLASSSNESSDALDKSDIQAILAKEYGDAVKIEIIEE